jgi:hypothetical protein
METPHDGNLSKDVHKRRPDKPRVDSQLSKGDLSEHQIPTDPIAGVTSQIAEVAESIKLVQKQVIEVGSKIEATKNELNRANLPNEKNDILVMELKNLMDEKKSLMGEKKSLMNKEERLMNEKKSMMDEKKGHQKHSDGWREWWKSNLNKMLAGSVSIVAIIAGLATFNKETDRSLENIYNSFSSSLANAKFLHVSKTNYVTRLKVESQILEVYNNKSLEEESYVIVYGVKGAGKTSAVKHVLGNKPGVVLVPISQNDTNETIMNKIFMECGITVKQVPDLKKIVNFMGDAMVKRNGHPITIVFEVERGSSSPEVLSLVKHISKEFCLVANVIIVLSEANAVLGFGDDQRQEYIFVDEMTREEAEQLVKKRAPSISTDDFNKFVDFCGTYPLALGNLCKHVRRGGTVDEHIANVVDSARGDLTAFVHQPLIAALKDFPDGVRVDYFKGVEDKGVPLFSPGDVAPAMKKRNTIIYDFKANQYKLFSKAHKTALKTYDPPAGHFRWRIF